MEEIVFPNQIRMLRRSRGKSMKKLADVLGVSLSAVSKIEKGYRRVDDLQLTKMANFLNFPKESFFVSEKNSQPEVVRAWQQEQERRKKINVGSGLKTLGAGLRFLRGEKALTLNRVARGAGITLSVYHRIEMGQREVDEKTFKDIAHALGFSETDLQLKIYELDMSGALEELKKSCDGKGGLYVSKGGYNDIPLNRYMLRSNELKEINTPVCGTIDEGGSVVLDRQNPITSVLAPSGFAFDENLFAVQSLTDVLGPALPHRSVLIVSPASHPKEGDLALCPLDEKNTKFKLVVIGSSAHQEVIKKTLYPQWQEVVDKEGLEKMYKVVLVMMP